MLAKKILRRMLDGASSHAAARRCLERIPPINKRISPWQRLHPFDRQYGTDTAGFVTAAKLVTDKRLHPLINPYAGSQPGIVRAALSALGSIEEYDFVDIGCGKARAMIVASEFPFRGIVGIEISQRLAMAARRNLAILNEKFPRRPPATLIEGNAVEIALPARKLVLFLYHAFGAELLGQLTERIERHIECTGLHMFVVYYNPVHGSILDASPAFTRWYAKVLACDESEVGFGPRGDTVVIWQSKKCGQPTPHASPNREIVIKEPLWIADLAT